MIVHLTDEELEIILDALASYPDPEDYDFGPAYENVLRETEVLVRKLMKGRKHA